jgi:hypothetical protein
VVVQKHCELSVNVFNTPALLVNLWNYIDADLVGVTLPPFATCLPAALDN